MRPLLLPSVFVLVGCAGALAERGGPLVLDAPMAAPRWATLQRELLRANSEAVEMFAARYLDERGHLRHVPRWGTLDGPDDAIETFYNWTLLHALGGDDAVLDHFKRAWEGHLEQYGALRTTLTELARDGAYRHDFITMSDWFHTGEGMRGIFFLGLSDPTYPRLVQRMKRFAGLYMNEDPTAPNYDPRHKIIRSIWNGSLGPMLRKATVYDWVGDPVEGRFHFIHSGHRLERMLEFREHYPKMLAHCAEYLDSEGDTNLNLAATSLALTAYMLTGEEKYRDWVLEYVGAWRERAALTGGNIPSNVGLDGKIGGTYGGQWWKGTYGWNFTIWDGEIEAVAHRNYVFPGSWSGFGNAYLLSGDPTFIDTLRRQMDNIYAQKKVVDGKVLLPTMYGDPRGYRYDGPPTWYRYTENLFTDRLTEIYLWSMERRDLARLPMTGWIGFLHGREPGYPERALEQDLERLRARVEAIRRDPTTAETRLADYLLDFTPAQTHALTNLMLGGYFTGRIWTLHSRVRYFDPARRRAGIPEDVAALVEEMTADSVTLTVVNTSPTEERTVVIQAGGHREHQFLSARVGARTVPIQAPFVTVRLPPGSGGRVVFQMKRYASRPTLALPWQEPRGG